MKDLRRITAFYRTLTLACMVFCFVRVDDARAQCEENIVDNPGFEEVNPPCGAVPPPPFGLINGSFNQGCMGLWEAAWGTPSVCSGGPYTGDYYCCLGANNEGVFQNLNLCTAGVYELSFYYRRLNAVNGSLRVFLASGLVNQPMSNSGNPPLPIQGSWQELANVPINNNNWQFFSNPSFQVTNPANNQLLFLLVPAADIGFDDIVLRLRGVDPEIACASTTLGTYTFSGSIPNPPNGYTITSWSWDFGDGQTASGQSVTHTFGAQGTYQVCLTTTDQCGCQRQTCQTIIYDQCSCGCGRDEAPPQLQQPIDQSIQVTCLGEAPPPPVLQVQDDCDDAPTVSFLESVSGPLCGETLLRQWVVSDRCGNTLAVSQTIQALDDQPPFFIQEPSDLAVACPDPGPAFLAWIDQQAGAVLEDFCSGVTWTAEYDSIPQFPCGATEVRFTWADTCGNSVERTLQFLVEDIQPPDILAFPEDLIVFCLPSIADTLQAWLANNGGGQASDGCGPVFWSNNFNGDTSQQIIPVQFTVQDLCGNTVTLPARFIRAGGNDTTFQTIPTCDPLQVGIDTLVIQESGCKVWVITTYELVPSDTVRLDTFTCDPLLSGADTLLLANQNGCDSLIITRRTLSLPDTTLLIATTCDPAQADTLIQVLPGWRCDSVVMTITLSAFSPPTFLQSQTCDPLLAGTETLLLVNAAGCDSLVITETLLQSAWQGSQTVLLCGEGTPYTDTLVVSGGPCDSLFITEFLYRSPDTTLLASATCDPAQTGQFIAVLQGSSGCDSVLITTVNLLPRDTLLVEGVTCFRDQESFDTLVLSNQFGCDSVILNAILWIGRDTTFLQRSTCDSSATGTFVRLFPLPGTPCDSVVVETLTWAAQSETVLTERSCDPAGPAADTLFLTSQEGCDSLIIRIFQYTDLQALPDIQGESCPGFADGSILAGPVSGGQSPYRYRLNGGNWQAQPLFEGLAPGTYTITLEDAGGCTRELSGLVVSAALTVSVDIGPDREVEPGAVITLSAQSGQPFIQWQWSAPDPLSCATCSQTELGPITQAQSVSFSGVTADGCPADDALRLTLRQTEAEIPAVFIPNSFSPNGDGINDLFSVYGNAQVLEIRRLAVYDRWGNALYQETNIPPNAPSRGWDGSFRGRPMDPGVFVYVAEVVFQGGRTRIYKGDVTLVR